MEKEVLRTVKKYNLISEGDSVIVGLSGGADSVSLLLCLLKLKECLGIKEIIGVHINHCLRPTADRDEEFSKKLCEKYNIPFYSEKADIKKLKNELSVCEEEAGRIVRYNFFNKIREITGAEKIATAHNKNDCTETFFIRLFRGGGSESLSGIKPKREDGVIRPLINTSRESILAFLKENLQDYMTDETNLETDYLRNKIRLKLIPYLKSEFSLKDDGIVSISDSLREDSDYIKEEAKKIFDTAKTGEDEISFPLTEIKNLHPALLKRVFQLCVINLTGKTALSDTLLNIISIVKKGKTGKRVVISDEFIAVTEYESLIFKRNKEIKEYCYTLIEGDNNIKELKGVFTLSFGADKGKMTINIPEFKKLTVRTRKNGDKMYIKNTGTKKLKDIFIDKKIPKDKRDIYPVVEMDGEIIWLPGLYKREFENCKYSLKLKWENGYEK